MRPSSQSVANVGEANYNPLQTIAEGDEGKEGAAAATGTGEGDENYDPEDDHDDDDHKHKAHLHHKKEVHESFGKCDSSGGPKGSKGKKL